MWQVSLASFAGARPLTRTTCATRNPEGLSLKVSDEFTVPLCAIHHHHIHTTGKEREWWQERNIDPLKVASALWRQSRERHPVAREADLPEVLENDQRQSLAQENDDATAGTPHPSDSANREP